MAAKEEIGENDVRAIVREMLKKEISRVEGKIYNKTEIRQIAREVAAKAAKDAVKDILTRDDVKRMIRKTIVAQYKYLWEKSSFFINQI